MALKPRIIKRIERMVDLFGGGPNGKKVLADKMRRKGATFTDNGTIDNWLKGRNGWTKKNKRAFIDVYRDYPLAASPDPVEELPEMDLPEIVEVPDIDDTIPHEDVPRLLGFGKTDELPTKENQVERKLANLWLNHSDFLQPIIRNKKIMGVQFL